MSYTITGDASDCWGSRNITKSKGFGLFQMFARPSQQNGLTFTYKTPERLIPEAYDRTASADGQDVKVPEVDITANIKDWLKFEIQDTEFATQVLAEAEKSRLANQWFNQWWLN